MLAIERFFREIDDRWDATSVNRIPLRIIGSTLADVAAMIEFGLVPTSSSSPASSWRSTGWLEGHDPCGNLQCGCKVKDRGKDRFRLAGIERQREVRGTR